MSRAEIFQRLREQKFADQPEPIQRFAQELPALVQRLAETSLKPEGIDTALQRATTLLQEGSVAILSADWRDEKVHIITYDPDELSASDLSLYQRSNDLYRNIDKIGASIIKCHECISQYLNSEFGNLHIYHNQLLTGEQTHSTYPESRGVHRTTEKYILGRNIFGGINSYGTRGFFSKIILIFASIFGVSFKKEAVHRGLESLKEEVTSRFQPLEQPTYTNKEINILLTIEELQTKLRA